MEDLGEKDVYSNCISDVRLLVLSEQQVLLESTLSVSITLSKLSSLGPYLWFANKFTCTDENLGDRYIANLPGMS